MNEQIDVSKIAHTFPWTEQTIIQPGHGGLVRVLDNKGAEVPIHTITALCCAVSRKMAFKPETKETPAS